MIVGTNAFRWWQHYQNLGKTLDDHLDEALAGAAEAGLETWEPTWEREAQVEVYQTLLPKHGLKIVSVYLPINLISGDLDAAVSFGVQRAKWAKELGCQYVVTNPDPVNWSGTPKPDHLIVPQSQALRTLGQELNKLGVRLCYHFHSPELAQGAREVHQSLQNSSPDEMGICMDPHWVWTGCDRSQLAVEVFTDMYLSRIDTLHLRQSHGGVWSEHLEDGDLSFHHLFGRLKERGWSGPVMIEHGWMPETPVTMPLAESHRKSLSWFREAWEQA